MTAVDALTMDERNARAALRARVRELQQLAEDAADRIARERPPAVVALTAKASSVAEAADIWQATKHALDVALRGSERSA